MNTIHTTGAKNQKSNPHCYQNQFLWHVFCAQEPCTLEPVLIALPSQLTHPAGSSGAGWPGHSLTNGNLKPILTITLNNLSAFCHPVTVKIERRL